MKLYNVWKRKFDIEFWKWFDLKGRIVGMYSGFVLSKEVLCSYLEVFGLMGIVLMCLDILDVGWEYKNMKYDEWWEE